MRIGVLPQICPHKRGSHPTMNTNSQNNPTLFLELVLHQKSKSCFVAYCLTRLSKKLSLWEGWQNKSGREQKIFRGEGGEGEGVKMIILPPLLDLLFGGRISKRGHVRKLGMGGQFKEQNSIAR